jgi:D-alanine-D-alanine ligase
MINAAPEGHAMTDGVTTRPRVAVVFGGTSSEHPISCLTAGSVLAAIDRDRYDVVAIGITRSGRWVVVPDDLQDRLQVLGGTLPEISEDLLDAIWLRTSSGTDLAITADGTAPSTGTQRSALARLGSIDVAFALLHGPFGEDGTIQGMFEMMGTRYVGAGVLASAVGMDKIYMKMLLAAAGLPIGPFVPILPREWASDRTACLEAVAALHHPLYVKPARGGSSLGITRVVAGEDLVAAIEHARQFDPKVIVEEGFVDARELECGVLGGLSGAAPEASQVAEIRVHTESGFYDFDAKYPPTSTPTSPSRCAGWPCERSTRSAARAWPGSTSSSPETTPCTSTRSTRCPASPPSRCSRGCGRPVAWTTRIWWTACSGWLWSVRWVCADRGDQAQGCSSGICSTASATSTRALASGAYAVGTPICTYADRPIVVNR